MNNKVESAFADLAKIVLPFSVAVWGFFVFYAPHERLKDGEKVRLGKPLVAVYEQLALQFPSALITSGLRQHEILSQNESIPEIRVEPRGGDNLQVYLSKRTFESVAYPDRKEFVRRVGDAWCEQVDHFLLPTVEIGDIRSGENLATYRCWLPRKLR